jgi:UDPglucose 6-dehydrogenase
MTKITIIGSGYVGLITGVCFAELGHVVTVVDVDEEKVRSINDGKPPIYEDGLEGLLRKHAGKNLHASSSYATVSESEVIFIAVGTPPLPDGSADLQYIKAAAEEIGTVLQEKHMEYPIVVVKSTVPPTTTRDIVYSSVKKHMKDPFGYCMNPEFLREGRAIYDFMHPDRIVIGSQDEHVITKMQEIYADLDVPVLITDPTAAEMIKYAANAMLATRISFSNEIGNLCKQLGIDVYEVMEGVGLDTRIGPAFLNAGAGFGGSCFPKDVSALAALAVSYGINPILLRSVIEVNDQQPKVMISLLEKRVGDLAGKQIAVLGLAFKDNTDDIRESRALCIIALLHERGARISCYDPMAMEHVKQLFPPSQEISYMDSAEDALDGADACLIMTEWPEFSKLDNEFSRMKEQIIIDGRHILDVPHAEGLCW